MILPSGVAGLTIPSCLSTFTGDDLLHHSALVFDQEIPKTYSRNSSLSCEHTESQALASCKFLTLEEDQYLAGYVPCPTYLVGYFLAKLWERDFKDEGSVITESIVNHNMGLAPALGVKVEAYRNN